MQVEPFLVSSTVNVIIAQRLIRKICPSCKISTEVNFKDVVDKLGVDIAKKYFKCNEKQPYIGKTSLSNVSEKYFNKIETKKFLKLKKN